MSLALSFVAGDKASASIADGSQTGLDPGTSDFSIAFFVQGTTGTLINKGTISAGDGGYRIGLSVNKLVVQFRGETGSTISVTGTTLLNTSLHSVVVTFDRDGNATAYIDGVPEMTLDISAYAAEDLDSIRAFTIGAYSSGELPASATISHPRFWTRLLTADEIARQCNVAGGVPYARPYAQLTAAERVGLQGCWDDPPTEIDSTHQWTDLSSNGNHLSFSATNIIDATTLNGGIETLTAGTEAFSNTGFETAGAGGADVFGSWSEFITGGTDGTIVRDTSVYNNGSASCQLYTGTTVDNSGPRVQQTATVVAGSAQRLTFYTRGDGTYAGRYRIYDATNAVDIFNGTTGITGTSFTQVTKDFQCASNTTAVVVYFYRPASIGGTAWFDDVSLKPLSPATWTKSESGTSKVQVELTAPAGAYACRLDVDGSNSSVYVLQYVITSGRKYTASVYAKADSGNPTFRLNFGGGTTVDNALNTSYSTYTGSGTSGGNYFAIVRLSATSNSIFLDNITLISTAIPSVAGPPTTVPFMPWLLRRRRRMRAA